MILLGRLLAPCGGGCAKIGLYQLYLHSYLVFFKTEHSALLEALGARRESPGGGGGIVNGHPAHKPERKTRNEK